MARGAPGELGPAPALLVLGAVATCAVLAWLALAADRAPSLQPGAGAGSLALVINLARNRGDRLARFAATYAASDMSRVPLQRLEAVDGGAVLDAARAYVEPAALAALDVMRRTGVRAGHRDLTPGAVGCYLSHVQAWRAVAASSAPYAFVFEDDADVPRDLLARFERARAQAGPGWDVLLLGYDGDGVAAGPDVVRVMWFLRLHAYALTPAAARKLCECALPISQQVDWEVSRAAGSGRLRVYGMRPSAVGVTWQGSTVQSPLAAHASR